jgi:hypothetical protein
MWRWATCSRGALALLLVSAAQPAAARVFLSTDEALRLAFPECAIERATIFLTAEQMARAEELAGGEIESALVYAYRARRNGRLVGTAYFDAHVVRTLPEVLMVVVDPEGRVARVEVLSFQEPEDYLPRANFYGQFAGRGLDGELAPRRGIRSVAGATLTVRATTAAVRRVLALHQVLTVTAP